MFLLNTACAGTPSTLIMFLWPPLVSWLLAVLCLVVWCVVFVESRAHRAGPRLGPWPGPPPPPPPPPSPAGESFATPVKSVVFGELVSTSVFARALDRRPWRFGTGTPRGGWALAGPGTAGGSQVWDFLCYCRKVQDLLCYYRKVRDLLC